MEIRMMPSVLRVVLVDINPHVVATWSEVFRDLSEVEVVHGSLLDQDVDAWVSPTNSRGSMDGGVDAAIKHHLGSGVEDRVQTQIARQYRGSMPIGHATCVATGVARPNFLISAPTMTLSAQNIRRTNNVAWACAAAFQAIWRQNEDDPVRITSVALPGLGAATGRLTPRVCAEQMKTGYTLLRDGGFRDFEEMRAALDQQLDGGVSQREEPVLRAPLTQVLSDVVRLHRPVWG
jgi:O-acetyl-ADP-ribose deacetylase (regulator of RNase III)